MIDAKRRWVVSVLCCLCVVLHGVGFAVFVGCTLG